MPNPLVNCKRCDKHMNPITATEYLKLNERVADMVLANGGLKNPNVLVCQYCGWKVRR